MRKEERVAIPKSAENNRDAGKTFLLTEMSAMQAEKWAARALLALVRSGHDVAHVQGSGMAALAISSFQALSGVQYEEIEPLLEEMMGCVQIRLASVDEAWRPLVGQDDIEEMSTLFLIRTKLLELHTGFSLADVRSLISTSAKRTTSEDLPSTSISQ